MSDESPPSSSLILYQAEDGRTRIQCRFEGETVWLTQKLMAELFQKDVRTINEHLINIYDEGELRREATIRRFRIVGTEGHRQVVREVDHHNLDTIISVGYRVKSPRGTQFRIWATQRLREYLVKGFTMDDERLKNPPGKGQVDYFDELLERIRDIRASERRVYLRVREILALAADYEAAEPETQVFFQTIQNKLHFAATGKTAAELIFLQNWLTRLHDFLNLNERAILPDAGNISREEAHRQAEAEYERFATRRRAELEAQGEADLLGLLDAEVKKLPKRRKPKPPKDTHA